jgi:hypothetical protein
MRIFALTILFISGLYYFGTQESEETPQIDAIKTKMSAPERQEAPVRVVTPVRVKKVEPEVAKPAEERFEPEYPDEELRAPAFSDIHHDSDTEDAPEVSVGNLEEGWNTELKSMLSRLEPLDGENIHQSYMQAQENYQSEMMALMEEKQQKTTKEEMLEMDYIMSEVDVKHQEKLKEIFGAHYEAVRDHYDYFMETIQQD